MVRYTVVTISVFFTLIGLALFSNHAWENKREIASIFSSLENTLSTAASATLEADEAHVLLDNNAAYGGKLQAIREAKESIRMSYFIFSQDHSTMLLAHELILAAQRGVKVKIIVDFHSNYGALDFFAMLEREGAPNLQVRFYNRPSKNIVTDAFYLTTPCDFPLNSDQCYQQKEKLYKQFIKSAPASNHDEIILANTPYTKLFFKGLYTKNPSLIADAVFKGQRIDPKAIVAGGGPSTLSAEDKENLKELAYLGYKSISGNPIERVRAKTKLFAAYVMYRDVLGPIKATIQALLPVAVSKHPDHMKDWEYITDFTHHKILLVDGYFLQLGGRNLENSYHMDQNPLTAKYTFMDTDAALYFTKGGAELAKSYDDFFAYNRLQATPEEIRQVTSEESRNNQILNQWKEDMVRLANEYLSQYKEPVQSPEFVETIKPNFKIDLGKDSTVAYLENLHYFNREIETNQTYPRPVEPKKRAKLYGAKSGQEIESGKAIHAVLYQALEEVCDRKGPTNVIMHNAYTLPTADFYALFGKMIQGKKNCAHVNVSILTNSPDTTDLSMVNMGAKFGLVQFFNYYGQIKNSKSATFNFYEYRPISNDPSKSMSLHSKVFLIGNDVFVGSANFDPRSLMMDTNNGLYFKNVPTFASQYVAYFKKLVANKQFVTDKTSYYSSQNIATVIDEEVVGTQKLLNEFVGEKVGPEMMDKVLEQIRKLFTKISEDTLTVMKEGKASDRTALNHLLQFI